MKNTEKKFSVRIVALLCVSAVAFGFLTVWLGIVIASRDTVYSNPDVVETKTVTVCGLRGEIYDRNGVRLVGNTTEYDLLLDYGSIPDSSEQLNEVLLSLYHAAERYGCKDTLSVYDAFPLDGTYPDYLYSSALSDPDSSESKKLEKILSVLELKPEETTVSDLLKVLEKKYSIGLTKYSAEECDVLIRFRVYLLADDFGSFHSSKIAYSIPMTFLSFVKENTPEGVSITVTNGRVYDYPGYASHILGRLGKLSAENVDYYSEQGYPLDAYVGTSGVELTFESYLRGQNGKMKIGYDKNGGIVETEWITEPICGHDVYLTIDIGLQIAAEDSLAETVEETGESTSGAIVSLEKETGGVLCMASYPTYDLTRFDEVAYYRSLSNDPDLPLLNRSLIGTFAPGSIYKIGSAISALETGMIDRTTEFLCNEIYSHEGSSLHPKCTGKHGYLNVVDAIAVSCNCFFYEVGYRGGITPITEYTKPMGLGVSTGIELNESVGTVGGLSYSADWSKGNDLSGVIGQMHSYTPLQIAVFINTVASAGVKTDVHILDSVREFYTGNVIYSPEKKQTQAVHISESTLSTVYEGMRKVVTANAAVERCFSSLSVSVSGKTGTAEVDGQPDNALFAGFAPSENPEIVFACLIEKGEHGYNAAIPCGKILSEYFSSTEE